MIFSSLFKSTNVNNDIEILVLGRRGVGKTSLLATMLYKINEIADANLVPLDERTKSDIDSAINGMKAMFSSENDIGVETGIGGDAAFVDYNFKLSFVGKSLNKENGNSFKIIFHDHPGGVLLGNDDYSFRKLREDFLRSRVILVLYDAPVLMSIDKTEQASQIIKDNIISLFNGLQEDSKSKLTVLVPTKSEYYIRRNLIEDVNSSLKREFKELYNKLMTLNAEKKDELFKLYIAPVQTVGGLEFSRIESTESEDVHIYYRRTAPGSEFCPQQTDLLLMFCLKYVMKSLFYESVNSLTEREKNIFIKNLKTEFKVRDDKLLKTKLDEWEEDPTLEQFAMLFKYFIGEYSDKETVVNRVCRTNAIYQCRRLFDSALSIDKDYGRNFKNSFVEVI